MKIDIERLKVDPDYWDECGGEDFKYAFTTGENWQGSMEFVGCVEFACEDGVQDEENVLVLGDSCWVLVAERPEHATEWDGEAWPAPIGAKLENMLGQHRTVIAHDCDNIICRNEDRKDSYVSYTRSRAKENKLRPVRTKSERDKADLIKTIADAYQKSEKWQVSYIDVADAILAAGWKKP